MGNSQLPRPNRALPFFQRVRTIPVFVVTALVTLSVMVACGDSPTQMQPATIENVDRQFGVYALTGSPAGLPAAYQLSTEQLVRPQVLVNGALNFDIAFDISTDGKALVLPAALVSPVPPTANSPLAFLAFPGIYEQIAIAPVNGFVTDTSASLSVGQAILIRLAGVGCFFNEPFYAKLTIDSINVAERRLLVRALVNRNCGYRSLTAGLPTE